MQTTNTKGELLVIFFLEPFKSRTDGSKRDQVVIKELGRNNYSQFFSFLSQSALSHSFSYSLSPAQIVSTKLNYFGFGIISEKKIWFLSLPKTTRTNEISKSGKN